MSKTIGIINNPANRKNIENLEGAGFKVILIPELQTEKAKNNSDFEKIMENFSSFEWLIFTDIFAVDYFIEELNERNYDLYELDNLRVCAYGEAVADRLRFSQIHADVIPGKLDDKTILKDLKNYIATDNDFNYLSFLIIRGNETGIGVKKDLEKISKNIEVISVYSVKNRNSREITKIKALIKGGAFDEIMFFSAEDLQMFKLSLGLNNLKDLSQSVRLTSKNETVQKSIEESKF